MTVRWKNGRDMRAAQQQFRGASEALREGALIVLEEVIEEGAVDVQDLLEAAVTRTGRARERLLGGFPGRHDTGNMVGSVSYEIRDRRSRVVTGVFGWWGANFERYFRDQDLGEGNIPAARALPQAMAKAREEFRRRIAALVKRGTVDG